MPDGRRVLGEYFERTVSTLEEQREEYSPRVAVIVYKFHVRKEWGIAGQIGTYLSEGIRIDLYCTEGLEVSERERNRSV